MNACRKTGKNDVRRGARRDDGAASAPIRLLPGPPCLKSDQGAQQGVEQNRETRTLMNANADLVQQALALYFDDHTACCTEPAQGGINNCTQRVKTPRAGDYILRVYNNGRNSDKVSAAGGTGTACHHTMPCAAGAF